MTAIVLAREEGRLSVKDYTAVVTSAGLRRPVDDPVRIGLMLVHSNLVVTARDQAGGLIGLARCMTDFGHTCYLADLCVVGTHQGLGIGRRLLTETKRLVGAECQLLLLSVPTAMDYYPRLGMEPVSNGFLLRRER